MSFTPATIPPADMDRIQRAKWVKFSVNQVLAFVAAWNGGVDTATVAKAFGCKPGSLRVLCGKLKQIGVTMRAAENHKPRPRPSAPRRIEPAPPLLPAIVEKPLHCSAKAILTAIMAALEGRDQVPLSAAALEAASGVVRGSCAYYLAQLVDRGLITAQSQGRGRPVLYARPGFTPRAVMVVQGSKAPASFWTPERVALAKKLYVEEGKSATAVAQVLGCSRCAVMAKKHRAGWDRGTGAQRANAKRSHPNRRDVARPDRPPVPKAEPGKLRSIPLKCDPVTLVALEKCQCRYPVAGEGADTLFCGVLRESDDKPYCPGHMALATDPSARPAPKDLYDPSIQRTRSRAAA